MSHPMVYSVIFNKIYSFSQNNVYTLYLFVPFCEVDKIKYIYKFCILQFCYIIFY